MIVVYGGFPAAPIFAAAPALQYKDAATDRMAIVKNVRVAEAEAIEVAQSLTNLAYVFCFIGPPYGQRRPRYEDPRSFLRQAHCAQSTLRMGYAEHV